MYSLSNIRPCDSVPSLACSWARFWISIAVIVHSRINFSMTPDPIPPMTQSRRTNQANSWSVINFIAPWCMLSLIFHSRSIQLKSWVKYRCISMHNALSLASNFKLRYFISHQNFGRWHALFWGLPTPRAEPWAKSQEPRVPRVQSPESSPESRAHREQTNQDVLCRDKKTKTHRQEFGVQLNSPCYSSRLGQALHSVQ